MELRIGDQFRSWHDFSLALEEFSQKTKTVWTIAKSRTVDAGNKRLKNPPHYPDTLKYCYVKIGCKHYGPFRNTGTGQRTKKSFKSSCQAYMYLTSGQDRSTLILKEFVNEHNHPTGDIIYHCYPEHVAEALATATTSTQEDFAAAEALHLKDEHPEEEFISKVEQQTQVWAEPLDIKEETIDNCDVEQQPRLFFEQPMHSIFSSEEPKLQSQTENDDMDDTWSAAESSRPMIEQPLVSAEPDIPKQKTSENLNDSVSIFGLVSKLLQNPRPEDACDIVGISVATKLKGVSKDQRICAERLISEVLFEAELGNLSRECSINVPRYKQNSKNTTYDGEYHSEKNKKLKTI